MNQWIRVEDALPAKTPDVVLVTIRRDVTGKCESLPVIFDGEYWYAVDRNWTDFRLDQTLGTVLAWMPLPEPFTG